MKTEQRKPPPPPASRSAARTATKPTYRIAVRKPRPMPPKIVLYAPEGWGKTTFAAHSPDPLVLMSEPGLDTLISAGRVAPIPAEPISDWPSLMSWLKSLSEDLQGRETIVLDATSGFERQCHEYICKRDFRGDWGERGFAGFQRGYEVSLTEWCQMLGRLDAIHAAGATIVLLGHAKVSRFSNPLGADYDRMSCDSHHKAWSATCRWADAVLFGQFFTVIDQQRSGKGKGIGGTDRVVHTTHRDGYDAKNRYGMPEDIWLEDDPATSWDTIMVHILKGSSNAS